MQKVNSIKLSFCDLHSSCISNHNIILLRGLNGFIYKLKYNQQNRTVYIFLDCYLGAAIMLSITSVKFETALIANLTNGWLNSVARLAFISCPARKEWLDYAWNDRVRGQVIISILYQLFLLFCRFLNGYYMKTAWRGSIL